MNPLPILTCAALLAACTVRTEATIADLETDKVVVQALGGNDLTVIDAEAQRGCRIHGRRAQRISYTCVDLYCSRRDYLYACMP